MTTAVLGWLSRPPSKRDVEELRRQPVLRRHLPGRDLEDLRPGRASSYYAHPAAKAKPPTGATTSTSQTGATGASASASTGSTGTTWSSPATQTGTTSPPSGPTTPAKRTHHSALDGDERRRGNGGHLRRHRLPRAGHADLLGVGGLFARSSRSSSPRHGQEEKRSRWRRRKRGS